MNNFAIQAEHISKCYRIGLEEKKSDTLSGRLASLITSPVQNLRRLRSLNRFTQADDASVHWALTDVSFNVKEGEVLGIIGHNGAGKSTLLKILSRVTEPTSGEIIVKGRLSALLEVGTGFHPELSGRDNIYMNGTLLGMTKREINVKLDEIIEFSGVAKYLDTPVKFYSSGMKVRLGFAVAAHLEPDVLIVDEVLSVGDAQFQRKCIGKMQDVAQHGRTVIFVSHDMSAVEKLCQEVILLEKGQIVNRGPAPDILKQYIAGVSLVNTNTTFRLNLDYIKIKSVTINGHIEAAIKTSDGFEITLEYELMQDDAKYAQVKLEFFDEKQNPAVSLSNTFSENTFDALPLNGKIIIKVKQSNLNVGVYNIHLKIRKYKGEHYTVLRDILTLNILPGHTASFSRLPDYSFKCLLESDWTI